MTENTLEQNSNPTSDADIVELSVKNLNVWYKNKTQQALFDVNIDIYKNKVTAFIGPSGCGKSTFLRTLNRMNDYVDGCVIQGNVIFNGENIYDPNVNIVALRRRIGMVFQRPNPFPKSIYENIVYGPKLHGIFETQKELDHIVQKSLQRSGLYEEVSDRLHTSALDLSGGQQQRLCIARAIAISPELILMDEPCASLDPKSSTIIEKLILELRQRFTIIIVTHSMQQAKRLSDYTAFFHMGKLLEYKTTQELFENPTHKHTIKYVTGVIG